MGLLNELIQRNAWQELFECLSSRNRSIVAELFMTDRLGRTPLHYACAKKQAPQHIVALMLHHVGQKWFSSRDICGNTALHAAAFANGNAQIVKLLLESLHSRRLQYINDVGSTPLLMAWKKYLNPTSTLFGHVNARGVMSCENVSLLTSVRDILELQQDDEYHRLRDVWNKTIVLVGHHASNNKGIMTRPLHDLLLIGSKRHVQCPTVAYWLAIRLYPHHLHLNDEHGNLAIHVAAKHASLNVIPMHANAEPVSSTTPEHGNDELSIVTATESALTQLAKACPKGAVTFNRQDRLPIHLAIQSGKSFDEDIRALVHAAPQTLEQRDSQTKLYPFLLAATSPKAPLTVVWELIRARPHLIRVNATRGGHPCIGKRPPTEATHDGTRIKKAKKIPR